MMNKVNEKLEALARLNPVDNHDEYLQDCGIANELSNKVQYYMEYYPNNTEKINEAYQKLEKHLDYSLKVYGKS